MGLTKRTKAVLSHRHNLTASTKLELLPPFGQGAKAGASGIWAADVPAIKRSFQLLEGLSMVRRPRVRFVCMSCIIVRIIIVLGGVVILGRGVVPNVLKACAVCRRYVGG